MKKTLWIPGEEVIRHANITRFINFVNKNYNLEINSYRKLYNWSIENIPDFWAAVWEFSGVIASRSYEKVLDDSNKFLGAK